jgi:hypothetical protein
LADVIAGEVFNSGRVGTRLPSMVRVA